MKRFLISTGILLSVLSAQALPAKASLVGELFADCYPSLGALAGSDSPACLKLKQFLLEMQQARLEPLLPQFDPLGEIDIAGSKPVPQLSIPEELLTPEVRRPAATLEQLEFAVDGRLQEIEQIQKMQYKMPYFQ